MKTHSYDQTSNAHYPFPQANSLGRAIAALSVLCDGAFPRKSREIARALRIHPRQAQFYTSALAFLGLAKLSKDGWLPTSLGMSVGEKSPPAAMRAIAKRIARAPVFSQALYYVQKFRKLPSHARLQGWILRQNASLNEETAARRAQTVVAWVRDSWWFLMPLLAPAARR